MLWLLDYHTVCFPNVVHQTTKKHSCDLIMIRMPLPENLGFWMIFFPSCGNGLAPVLEILMNNNIVSPIFIAIT